VEVERGGDATWHGPGQLVAYPIVKLEGERADLHGFLRGLEEAVIRVLVGLGLSPVRDVRNTGVWLPDGDALPRKVCSVGIACRKWVTWHGLALNVAVDPAAFARIRPCGFGAEVMTRLADALHPCPTVDSLILPLAAELSASLDLAPGEVEERALEELIGE
jgi:lipoyl(octanoyl) transferase